MKYDLIHIKADYPDIKHLVEIEITDSADFIDFFNKFGSEADFIIIAGQQEKEYFLYPYRNYIFKTETRGYKTIGELEVGVISGCGTAEDFYHKEAFIKGFESIQEYFKARGLGFIDTIDTIQSRYRYYIYQDEQIKEFLDLSSEGAFYRSVMNAGYRNYHDFDEAVNKGFKTSFSYYLASESGFLSAHDFEEASRLGFINDTEYHEAKKQGFHSKTEMDYIKWREDSGRQGFKMDEDFLYYLLKFEVRDDISSDDLYHLFKKRIVEVFGNKFGSDYSKHSFSPGISSEKERDKYRKLYKKSIHYKEDLVYILTEKMDISDIASYKADQDIFILKK